MNTVKVYTAVSAGEIEEWINSLENVDYDSIKITCHSCDNSTSGVQFVVILKLKILNHEYRTKPKRKSRSKTY